VDIGKERRRGLPRRRQRFLQTTSDVLHVPSGGGDEPDEPPVALSPEWVERSKALHDLLSGRRDDGATAIHRFKNLDEARAQIADAYGPLPARPPLGVGQVAGDGAEIIPLRPLGEADDTVG
jgi:hypothetical protein